MVTIVARRAGRARPAGIAPAGGVRLHVRRPVTPHWLAGAVLPAVRGLASPRLRVGWLHGPHVDVRADDAPAGGWTRFAGSLDAGPAVPGALDPADYLDRARARGRLEAVPPPYLPLAEHGAVAVLDAPTRSTRGGPGPVERVESVLCAAVLDTVDAVVARPAEAPARLTEVFVALADAGHGGLAAGGGRFRAHADEFLTRWGSDRDLRGAFAARLGDERDELGAVVDRYRAGVPGPHALTWQRAIEESRSLLDGAAPEPTSGGAPADTPAPAHDPAARVLTRVVHDVLELLAVSPVQRFYVYYAVGELLAARQEVEVP